MNISMQGNNMIGIILAGGRGSRMGVDKALMPFNGKKLIEYAVELFQSLRIEILISTGNTSYDFLNLPSVYDLKPGSGPMGGIYSCMKHRDADWYLVQACDTPFLDPALYSYLLSLKEYYQIIVPDKGNAYYEPLCGIYHHSVMHIFENYIEAGNFKILGVINEVKFLGVPINKELPFYSPCLFHNVNSPHEIAAFRKFDKNCRGK